MRLVCIGASGHCKVCAEIAALSGSYDDIFFLDDDRDTKNCGKYEVVGTSNDAMKFMDDHTKFFVSIGNKIHRENIQNRVKKSGGKIATLIHPNAFISPDASIGEGSVVMAGAIINPDAIISEGVIINTASSVDHDCNVGAFSHVAVGAHLCGTATVGKGCWIGAGATVSNNINICNDCVIGAGAVAVKDVEVSGTYVGVPAKKI